jgi:hypothetical protein
MSLTAAQQTTLATNIQANANTVTFNGVPTVISAIPHSSDGAFAVAAWYNLLTASFFGNYRSVPLSAIRGAIVWKNLTSLAPMPASPSTDTAPMTWINACINDQLNLEILLGLGASGTFDATPHVIWQGLKDCLSGVNSKADGTAQSAGWAAVQVILCRLGTNAEKLFADLTNGTGADNTHAAAFTFEGALSQNDVASLALWGT